MPNLVKIGRTQRDIHARVDELSASSGVPTEFLIVAFFEVTDCILAEQRVHEKLANLRYTGNREFFRLSGSRTDLKRLVQRVLEEEGFLPASLHEDREAPTSSSTETRPHSPQTYNPRRIIAVSQTEVEAAEFRYKNELYWFEIPELLRSRTLKDSGLLRIWPAFGFNKGPNWQDFFVISITRTKKLFLEGAKVLGNIYTCINVEEYGYNVFDMRPSILKEHIDQYRRMNLLFDVTSLRIPHSGQNNISHFDQYTISILENWLCSSPFREEILVDSATAAPTRMTISSEISQYSGRTVKLCSRCGASNAVKSGQASSRCYECSHIL
jgi:hypothetical protein